MRRAGRFRSASRGHLPGASLLPLSLGVVHDLVESALRQARLLVRPVDPLGYAPAKPGYPTIVPIGGLYERWDHLDPHLRRLNAIGFGVHVVTSLGRTTGTPDELARAVVDELRTRELHDVAILAHSKGGLVGKAALLLPEGRERIRVLVALATPFFGSAVAQVARRADLRVFRPSSREIVTLARRHEVDDRIVSIFATFDEMVAFPNQVDGGRNIEAIRLGHHFVLSSREVSEHIALELARRYGLPEILDPDDRGTWERVQGRRRDVVRDYGYALGWQLRSLVPDHARLERWRTGRPGKVPILLLPGVLERWNFLRTIGDRLHREGHPVHVVETLGSNRRGVPKQAERVAAYLDEHELRDVVIVAHSKGGLIGKFAMANPEIGWRLLGMVAVATPFVGSPYARFFLDPSVREFSPQHPVIRGLSRELDSNRRIVSIWPGFDQHIPTSSRLVGARANLEVPGTGHFRILASRTVVDAVVREVAALEHEHAEAVTLTGPIVFGGAARGRRRDADADADADTVSGGPLPG